MATRDDVVESFNTLSPADKAAVRRTVLNQPGGKALGDIWRLLLSGLFLLAVAAGVAAFFLYWNGNEAAGAFIAISTTVVGALIGLIAPSPVSDK